MSHVAEKRAARSAVKALLKAARPEDLAAQSAAICSRVLQLPVYTDAKTVGAYLTCFKLNEVDTTQLVDDVLRRQAKLYVPVVADKNSNMRMLHLDSLSCVEQVPPFGIQEPRGHYDDGSERQVLLEAGNRDFPQLMILPGLGFDRRGGRLGRGGGYYDKLISSLRAHAERENLSPPSLVALCFREQLLEAVPVDADGHDQRVDWLVTPDEVLDCRTL